MARRTVVSGVTLVVLLLVLVGMVVYGFQALTAPLPKSSPSAGKCATSDLEVRRSVTRGEVQVSVFNAGTRAGLASSTLDKLEAGGFRGGNTGNAPSDATVRKAVVWTTEQDDTAAQLVARALGRGTRVVVRPDDLGPGVDVLVGNRFRGLDPSAPRRMKLPKPQETCVSVGG